MRRVLVVLALVLVAPAPASASGGGLFPTFGGTGATASGPPFTYVTLPAGKRSVVEAIHKGDASVQLWRRLPGNYGTPMVAMDGSQTGLSADGSTLVLVKSANTYPPRKTELLVLHAQGLTTKDRVTLKGFSSVDAISPDGRWVYLTRYTKPARDPNAYEVRAYDLVKHRMDPKPLVDPREPDEKMTGQPMTRLADDRWAYTLYSGHEVFVHALDTVNRVAYCIDLEGVPPDLLTESVKLTLTGTTLHVGNLAAIDTRTHEQIDEEKAATPRATATPAPVKRESTSPWPFAVLGLVAVAAIAFFAHRRRSSHEVIEVDVAVR